jgi:SAM-dependent methyltransferase
LSADVRATVGGFGFQWSRGNELLRDARFSAPEVFLDFIAPVDPSHFQGKRVLDAGCGIGRFTILASRFGARVVVGVDLSDSVDAAFDNTRDLPNVLIAQADLFALPVRQAFDYSFSVAVLHHTANPARAFARVCDTVMPGGSVTAWVYGREGNGWIVYLLNPLRKITSRLPRPLLLALSHVGAVPVWAASKAVYRPLSRIASLRFLARRLFYFEYILSLSQFTYREIVFIVFDHAVPQLAYYIRRDEFERWFRDARLGDVVITRRGGNSWRGFGVRSPDLA